MPYTISKRGNQWCVIKIDDGQIMGCHDTRREALAQLAAIEASERIRYTYDNLDIQEIQRRIKRLEQNK